MRGRTLVDLDLDIVGFCGGRSWWEGRRGKFVVKMLEPGGLYLRWSRGVESRAEGPGVAVQAWFSGHVVAWWFGEEIVAIAPVLRTGYQRSLGEDTVLEGEKRS